MQSLIEKYLGEASTKFIGKSGDIQWEGEVEITRTERFHGLLDILITREPTGRSHTDPGDPMEWEIVGLEGTVWDDRAEIERAADARDLAKIKTLANRNDRLFHPSLEDFVGDEERERR